MKNADRLREIADRTEAAGYIFGIADDLRRIADALDGLEAFVARPEIRTLYELSTSAGMRAAADRMMAELEAEDAIRPGGEE